MEAVFRERVIHLRGGSRGAREDPALHQRQLSADAEGASGANLRRCKLFERCPASLEFVEVHKQKPRRVPDFVGKVPRAFDLVFAPDQVLSGRRHHHQRETHRVRSVLAVDVQRVNARAFGLGHLLPVRGSHDGVDIDRAEGNFSREFQPHHDHARDPEKQDLVSGNQQRGRVVGAQIFGLLRPAERRERPQRRAEPRVEHVGVLLQLAGAALCALRRRLARDDNLLAVLAMPRRNAVSPPELPRDRPIPDVAHPVEVHLAPVLGRDANVPLLNHRNGRLRQGLHLAEPLR